VCRLAYRRTCGRARRLRHGSGHQRPFGTPAATGVAPAVSGAGGLGGIDGGLAQPFAPRLFYKRTIGQQVRREVPQFGPPPTLGELQLATLGCGYGASAASITRRLLARWPSSGGGRTLPATNYGRLLAVPVAATKELPSSIQAGPEITLASIRSRPAQPMSEANGNGAGRSDVLSVGLRRSGSEVAVLTDLSLRARACTRARNH
jgi:hypothetical protein